MYELLTQIRGIQQADAARSASPATSPSSTSVRADNFATACCRAQQEAAAVHAGMVGRAVDQVKGSLVRRGSVVTLFFLLLGGCVGRPAPPANPPMCHAPGGGYVPCNFGYHGTGGP